MTARGRTQCAPTMWLVRLLDKLEFEKGVDFMKRKAKWFVISVLMLAILALLIFPVGKSFTLPFAADEVSSVILWSFWGYKEATDPADISLIMEEMNSVRLCGVFDFENYQLREGDYSYICAFYLMDGRIYQYSNLSKPGLTSIFMDADGTYYKAKNLLLQSVFDKLDLELRTGNPFPTE